MPDFITFPTLISKEEKFLSKKECDNIIKISNNIDLQNHQSLSGNAKSCHNIYSDFLKSVDTKIVKKLLLKIDDYSQKLGLKTLDISNSWINIQKENSQLNKHCHPESIVSGVVFLKCNKLSNKLYFYNPNPHIHYMSYNKLNDLNYSFVNIEPKIGDLILFPSWLMHGSDKEKNKCKERISLSFNTRYYEKS